MIDFGNIPDITKEQFDNILRFMLVMDINIAEEAHSPDYIIAKFNRFIGVDYDVYDTPQTGLHFMLEALLPKYHKKWKTTFPMPRIGS